ncbi:hypothetical protein FGG08_001017 [Glutinoglossum americanum]|uniref:DUF6594 domain-containing protein n=1 Tax=Glutinoglossum americanum TaxID=1670608 RepID=A0A9P8I981_9PEZI|nr:hypothetical protein FGG08_001017 [Glutinoglossum americanum]
MSSNVQIPLQPITIQTPPQLQLPPIPSSERNRARWRYVGYRGASEWMTSEDDFFIIRRFATLNTRVLLAKQAEISELERRLDIADEPSEKDYDNSTVLDDRNIERQILLKELWVALKEYNEFVKSYSELKARPPASKIELQNVKGWMEDNEGAICPEESSFVAERNLHDLMPVNPKPKAPLRRWLERQRKFPELWPFRQPTSPYLKNVGSEGSVYFSDKLLDRLVYGTTVLLAVAMLIAPLWWLNSVTNNTIRLGIITGFVHVFAAILGGVTIAKPFETMAATAGVLWLMRSTPRVDRYAAVLMVFMQNNSINNNSNNSSALLTQNLTDSIIAALAQSKLNLSSTGPTAPGASIAKNFTSLRV